MNTQKQILLIVILFFTMVGGCAAYTAFDIPHRAVTQAEWTHEESVTRGALLFANNCRTCHGIKGEGGVGLQLNKDDFKNQDPLVLAATRAMLTRTLDCGRAGTLMPAWLKDNGGALNARQIEHIVDFLTAPLDPSVKDEAGNATNKGWLEAVEFGHNLNRETNAIVGGDTLDTIAKQHGIGYKELASANGIDANDFDAYLKAGTELKIPGFQAVPDGYTYHVYKDNETIRKIADSQHVGAMILADLNNLPYKYTYGKDKAEYVLLADDNVDVIPGLFPGDTLKLPQGAEYTVTAGDTIQSIAESHGIQPSDITGLNGDVLAGVADDKEIDFERRLKLPAGTKAVVQPGQTTAVIATQHGIAPADLEKSAGVAAGAAVTPGQALTLPADARYVIQTGDTLAKVAAAHGITVDALAQANNLQPTAAIGPEVVLKLPNIDAYTVKGQSLKDVSQTLSNATPESMAEANGIPATAILRIGTKLNLPADAWGSAPPDAKNNGLACVQYTIPNSSFQSLPGVGTATATADTAAPTEISKDVTVTSHANDWTVTADGKDQAPNKGIVSIAKGTAVKFVNAVGLHTINVNGKNDDPPTFKQGETRTITFNTAGKFTIKCDFHPDMLATLFVQ